MTNSDFASKYLSLCSGVDPATIITNAKILRKLYNNSTKNKTSQSGMGDFN